MKIVKEVYTMTTEEKLKELILSRYKSIREFTLEIDFPYTTLDSIFKRGLNNSSVSNVLKICEALHISADALAKGEIVPIQDVELYHLDQVRKQIQELTESEKEICNKLIDLKLTDEELDEVYRYALFLKEKKP